MSAPSPMCRTAILMLMLAAGLFVFAPGPAFADATGADSAAPVHPAKAHGKVARAHAASQGRSAVHSHRGSQSAHGTAAVHSARRPSKGALSRRAGARQSHIYKHSNTAPERASTLHTRRRRTGESRRMAELEREKIDREAAAARDARITARSTRTETHSRQGVGASSAVAASLAMAAPIIGVADVPSEKTDVPSPPRDVTPFSMAHRAMPAPLRGSLALLERQDERLEADGLERIEDEDDLSARISEHMLVPLPVSDALVVNADLPAHHRYCRPWTARFVADLARSTRRSSTARWK